MNHEEIQTASGRRESSTVFGPPGLARDVGHTQGVFREVTGPRLSVISRGLRNQNLKSDSECYVLFTGGMISF